MQIKMLVTGLTIDPANNAPIVILQEHEGERVLPIWIGVIEASPIAFELEKVKLSRPMTHDLLKATIEALGSSLARVCIVELRDNTYYAQLILTRDGVSIEVDARPSDAIALALRADAPIFCDSEVLDHAHLRQDDALPLQDGAAPLLTADELLAHNEVQAHDSDEEELQEDDPQEFGAHADEGGNSAADDAALSDGPQPIVSVGGQSWQEVLEGLEPEAFGKYKM